MTRAPSRGRVGAPRGRGTSRPRYPLAPVPGPIARRPRRRAAAQRVRLHSTRVCRTTMPKPLVEPQRAGVRVGVEGEPRHPALPGGERVPASSSRASPGAGAPRPPPPAGPRPPLRPAGARRVDPPGRRRPPRRARSPPGSAPGSRRAGRPCRRASRRTGGSGRSARRPRDHVVDARDVGLAQRPDRVAVGQAAASHRRSRRRAGASSRCARPSSPGLQPGPALVVRRRAGRR